MDPLDITSTYFNYILIVSPKLGLERGLNRLNLFIGEQNAPRLPKKKTGGEPNFSRRILGIKKGGRISMGIAEIAHKK
jgi:hypothetical protein